MREITFDTRVESATFDERSELWTIVTDTGSSVTARICVMATGCLSTTRVPPFPSLNDFEGERIHPGAWPQERKVELRSKRVAVIGTGSTGIQVITSLAPAVEKLYVLQRTPNYSMPAHNHPLDDQAIRRVKETYPERRRESRHTRRGFPVPETCTDRSVFTFDEGERRARLERAWDHGGAIFTAVFGDVTTDHDANRIAANFVREQIRKIVRDPVTADRLCPSDHPLGGKRPCVDTGYFETFNRDNVQLIDLRETPIVEFTRSGLRTTEEAVELDAVVFATGYDAITGSLNAIEIRGRSGRTLKEKWANGPTAYLGICSAGFPNMFLITGPGSPSVLCNVVVSIEQHIELMLELLDRAQDEHVTLIEADEQAEARWAEHVAEIANGTLLVEANSWYLGANIPGKPRMFMPYAGGMASFDAECREIIQHDFEGFRFGSTIVGLGAREGG